MADRLVTGILLVGGASSRFGSPKAVARLRGETLAERAWRVLGEVCDERLAVGKQADDLELPFAVVDDGAEERAPIFGLRAGMYAASHDVCVVLPVDCPLVTPALLRALAKAVAVPQTGPLPGAYERTILPELGRRVASGELSLRGLNSNMLEVDETELTNVNTRIDLVAAAIVDWARTREDVRAVVVAGSQAREDVPADRWSDLDAILVVDDPEPYLADAAWVAEFGTPVLTFLEETLGGVLQRRVLYAAGEHVDLPLVTASSLDTLEAAAVVFARGYRVLVDKLGIAMRLRQVADAVAVPGPPTQRELTEVASDFWYHALWTAKKLRRGEVYVAKSCLDGYMKARCVKLLEWHARAVDPSADVWFDGRFLERWADPGAVAALELAYASYDLRGVARGLWATTDLFQGLEQEVASRLGLAIELDHADLRRRIAEVVPDPRRGSTL